MNASPSPWLSLEGLDQAPVWAGFLLVSSPRPLGLCLHFALLFLTPECCQPLLLPACEGGVCQPDLLSIPLCATASPLLLLSSKEPIKSRAPQLHLEYRFYKQLGNAGTGLGLSCCGQPVSGRWGWGRERLL